MTNPTESNNQKKRRPYQKPAITLICFDDITNSEQYANLIREVNTYSDKKKVPKSPTPD